MVYNWSPSWIGFVNHLKDRISGPMWCGWQADFKWPHWQANPHSKSITNPATSIWRPDPMEARREDPMEAEVVMGGGGDAS